MRAVSRGLVLLAIVAAFGGCGKKKLVPPGPAPPLQPPIPQPVPGGIPKEARLLKDTTELDAIHAGGKPYTFALVVKTRNNPFFTPMIEAADAEAKALGVTLEVQAPPQETDKEQQFAMVQQLVAKGVDAILIAPADSKAIVPALKEAQDKGILVINLDNRVDADTATAAGLELGGYVGADNEAGGKLAGEELATLLPAGSKVALLEGIRGVDNAEARKRGFEAGVQGKLEIVARESGEWDTAKANAKFQAILAAHPDVTGVFCANDKMALGVLKAIADAGKTGQIMVVGYDNIPDVKAHLDSGALAATIEQHPDLMGKYGVRMALGVLDQSFAKGKELLVTLEVIRAATGG